MVKRSEIGGLGGGYGGWEPSGAATPWECRAAQSRQARPEEAQEPSCAKGSTLTMLRHLRTRTLGRERGSGSRPRRPGCPEAPTRAGSRRCCGCATRAPAAAPPRRPRSRSLGAAVFMATAAELRWAAGRLPRDDEEETAVGGVTALIPTSAIPAATGATTTTATTTATTATVAANSNSRY